MGLVAGALRVAPWALAAAQTLLLHALLRRHARALAGYAVIQERLARADRLLNERGWGPAVLDPRPVAGLPEGALIYRSVVLGPDLQYDVALDPRHMDPIADAIVTGDTWYFDDYHVLLDQLKPGDTVLDLGGHLGTFALAAAALGCRVLCVEAAPAHVRLIEASARRNGFDALHVVHAAVTDHDGTLEFLPSGPWGTITNDPVEREPRMIQARTLNPVEVAAVRVDTLLDRVGWDLVAIVKMDIEGAELEAIHGMSRLLSRPDAPVLLYESNADALGFFGHARDDLEGALQALGYTIFDLEPRRLIQWRPGGFEPWSTVNRLAVKGEPPSLTGWRVTGPRTVDELVRRVLDVASCERALDRAYVARVLADADRAVRDDPCVRRALRRLSRDGDADVRAAAAWSTASGRAAPSPGQR